MSEVAEVAVDVPRKRVKSVHAYFRQLKSQLTVWDLPVNLTCVLEKFFRGIEIEDERAADLLACLLDEGVKTSFEVPLTGRAWLVCSERLRAMFQQHLGELDQAQIKRTSDAIFELTSKLLRVNVAFTCVTCEKYTSRPLHSRSYRITQPPKNSGEFTAQLLSGHGQADNASIPSSSSSSSAAAASSSASSSGEDDWGDGDWTSGDTFDDTASSAATPAGTEEDEFHVFQYDRARCSWRCAQQCDGIGEVDFSSLVVDVFVSQMVQSKSCEVSRTFSSFTSIGHFTVTSISSTHEICNEYSYRVEPVDGADGTQIAPAMEKVYRQTLTFSRSFEFPLLVKQFQSFLGAATMFRVHTFPSWKTQDGALQIDPVALLAWHEKQVTAMRTMLVLKTDSAASRINHQAAAAASSSAAPETKVKSPFLRFLQRDNLDLIKLIDSFVRSRGSSALAEKTRAAKKREQEQSVDQQDGEPESKRPRHGE